jgi:hypothetical protein
MDAARLLDPKNDAVFKRLFTGAPHLLDFALFQDEDQAIWCFELRDREQHDVRLGEELQIA